MLMPSVVANRFVLSVLICAHNRREKSLRCLFSLFNSVVPNHLKMIVYFLDDGSTDGTWDSVLARYPDVILIKGNGNLYWSGGIRALWAEASRGVADGYLWLNDDVIIGGAAISELIQASASVGHTAIICGSLAARDGGEITYGGRHDLDGPLIVPNGSLQPCRLINGNVTLVPRSVFFKIGSIDGIFVHDIGDFDYGLRAQRAGIRCYIGPSFVGICEKNNFVQKWRCPDVSIYDRVACLYSPLGRPHPVCYFRFALRYCGLFSALLSFVKANFIALFPKSIGNSRVGQ
jgi:glycosyltransferase involved in cell wall biosynthesis